MVKKSTSEGQFLVKIKPIGSAPTARGTKAVRVATGDPVRQELPEGTPRSHHPNWTVWNSRPTISLYSGVCLAHDIAPGHKAVKKLKESGDPRYQHFMGHLITLKKWQPLDPRLSAIPPTITPPTDRTEVSFANFLDFVREQKPFPGIVIPPQFWQLNPPRLQVPVVQSNFAELEKAASAVKISASAKVHTPPRMSEEASSELPSPDVSAEKPQVPPTAAKRGKRRLSKEIRREANRTINLDQPGFLSLHDVLEIIPVSRTSWYDGVAAKRYPSAVPMGGLRKKGYRTQDIKALVESLAKQGDNSQSAFDAD